MKKKYTYILLALFNSVFLFGQEPEREDDLGDVSDDFQTNFFEAIKQKGIENYDKAIDLLIDCKISEPENAAIHFELGKNYFELDKYQLAADAFETANRLKPNNEWILFSQYNLHKVTKNKAKMTELLEQLAPIKHIYKGMLARHYYSQREFEKTLQVIDQITQEKGLNSTYEKLRYQVYSKQKKHDKTANYIQQKISNHTAEPYDYTQLIYSYSILKNNDKAFETAKLFQQDFPSENKPYVSLYKYYISTGKTDKAIEALHRVTNSNGSLSKNEKYKVLKDFYAFTEKNMQYLPELEKALKAYPDKVIMNKMVKLYDKSNNTEKANELLTTASENISNNFADLKTVSELLIQKNKFEETLKISTKALSLYPAQPIFYLHQATAFNGINKPNKAIESLTLGIDYIIDNLKMEKSFYKQFAKAYELLGDTKNQQKYQSK